MSTVDLNGLRMDGHPWRVTKTDMLNGVGVRTASGDKANADGEWAGRSWRAARSGTISGLYKGTDPIDVDGAHLRLQEAVALDDVPVTFHMPAGPRTVFARRAGEVMWEWQGGNVVKWSTLMKAHDPGLYLGDGVTPWWSGTTARVTTEGGRPIPTTFPFTIDSIVTGGLLEFRNPGTTGRLAMWLYGPLVDPVITINNGDGQKVLAWDLTIPEGDFLKIDPARRESKLQGQSSRPPVQRGWPRLTSGSNQFRFHASSGASTGTLSVHAWPAY